MRLSLRLKTRVSNVWVSFTWDLLNRDMLTLSCQGDLGRYRMAIEDDEPRDREVWSNVARFW